MDTLAIILLGLSTIFLSINAYVDTHLIKGLQESIRLLHDRIDVLYVASGTSTYAEMDARNAKCGVVSPWNRKEGESAIAKKA